VTKNESMPQKSFLRAFAQKTGEGFKPSRIAHFAKAALVGQRASKSPGRFRCLDLFNHIASPMGREGGQRLSCPEEKTQRKENDEDQDKPTVDNTEFSLFNPSADFFCLTRETG
jgi:hypothetical protein